MSVTEGCINPSVVEFPSLWSSVMILVENNPQRHWGRFVSPLVSTYIKVQVYRSLHRTSSGEKMWLWVFELLDMVLKCRTILSG